MDDDGDKKRARREDEAADAGDGEPESDPASDAPDSDAEAAAESDAAPEAASSKSEARPGKRSGSKSARSAKLRHEGKSAKSSDRRPDSNGSAASRAATTRLVVVTLLALAAGAAVGWFGNDARAKAKLRTESAPAAAGSSGPCASWEQQICADTGDQSATCQQAKGATELLTPSTCAAALESVPATLAKVKVARASCDTLVEKLCKDLPKDSSACQMVRDRTPSFPSERCKGMLDQYDQVLSQLKMMDAQQGQMMGGPHGPGRGGPPGAAPPGAAPPRAAPPGAAPPPAAHP